MALSKAKTQWVAGGVVLGVLATMGVQYGVGKYETKNFDQEGFAFLQSYNSASDRNNFIVSHVSNQTGASIEFSTSQASEEDSNKCQAWYDYGEYYLDRYQWANDRINELMAEGKAPGDSEFDLLLGVVEAYHGAWNEILSRWRADNCSVGDVKWRE